MLINLNPTLSVSLRDDMVRCGAATFIPCIDPENVIAQVHAQMPKAVTFKWKTAIKNNCFGVFIYFIDPPDAWM